MSGGWILVSTSTDEYSAPYVAALRSAGVPEERIRVVGPHHPETPVRELAAYAKGVVLCGGLDVAPERYGEEILPHARVETSPDRDELEWSLLDAARDANVPVWGVCRGLQVLNVYFGGTLWQDLPTQVPSHIDHTVSDTPDVLAHTVRVLEPEAPLGERLARDVPMVNSRHHQAAKRLADGLVPVALSPDGLVEAAFLDGDGWWVRGVQWHPENLIALAQQRSLWADFAQAAGFQV